MSTRPKNNKGLIFLVVILFLSNIGLLLYFLMWNKPPHKPGSGKGEFSIVEYMKKEVGFNDEQTKQFRDLHEMNRDSLKLIGDSIRASKNALYKLINQPTGTTDSSVRAAAATLSYHQQRMELRMFRHFQRVRAICNPEQQVKLDSMLSKMNNRPAGYRRNGQHAEDAKKKAKS
jgi:periplasmic protein CpxP/Spy